MVSASEFIRKLPGARPAYHAVRSTFGFVENHARRLVAPTKMRGASKLHLGAGFRHMDGWANIDLAGPNIIWDLTKPLPVERGSVRFAYSEHFIEHIEPSQALSLLKNVRECLAPDGVLRISTPDLAQLIQDYSNGKLVQVPSHQWTPETLCQMVNQAMRDWGHRFIYDEPELTSLLREAGFTRINRVRWRQSDSPELQKLETRPDIGDLILEARA